MIKEGKKYGLKLMGFANHTWDESIPLPASSGFYKRQSMAFQRQIRTQIPEDTDGIKILIGAETEYCGMYDVLGMGKEAALELDYLLIPHTHVHMRNFVMPATDDVKRARENLAEILAKVEGITPARATALAGSLPEGELEPFMGEKTVDYVKFVSDFMVESFRRLMANETLRSYSDLLPVSVAHPFQPVGSAPLHGDMLDLISDNTFGELFEIAAKRGIGLEINNRGKMPKVQRWISIAKECGCKFTFGSDGHGMQEMKLITEVEGCFEPVGLTEYDLMDFVRV
jgi:histidinol phosphatase-like PHP family hydrolase